MPNPCHYQNYDRSMLYPAQSVSEGCPPKMCACVSLFTESPLFFRTSIAIAKPISIFKPRFFYCLSLGGRRHDERVYHRVRNMREAMQTAEGDTPRF